MEDIIFIGIVYGLVTCIVPVFIIIEIYCFVNKQSNVIKPIKKGMISGFFIGLVALLVMSLLSNGGESGLALVAMAPFLLVGYIVGGAIVGNYYKNFTTMLHRFRH